VAIEEAVAAEATVYSNAESQLHESIVQLCGNATLAASVGVLELLWRRQQQEHVDLAIQRGVVPNKRLREGAVVAHRHIVALIAEGKSTEAAGAMRQHHRENYDIATRRYVDHPIRVTVPNSEAMRVR
jgi:DNA-binding GntR family transcriptional regulator